MVDIKKLYDATNDGLEIVKWLFPQAEEGKKFCIRDEKTASASLHKRKYKDFGEVWGVTDFGDDGNWKNPIDLYMDSKNYTQNDFYEALQQLAQHFGVSERITHERNVPIIEKRQVLEGEEPGTRKWQTKDSASVEELAVMGRTIKQQHLNALRWKSVGWISYTSKDGSTIIKHSTDTYPIFIRECYLDGVDEKKTPKLFFKIYEPYNLDKGMRFQYYPTGVKPQRYINGMSELKQAYLDYNEKKRNEFFAKEENKDKCYEDQKLPCAFICSGERDALCCRSMGFQPLWFNSETYKVSDTEIDEIMKYINVLYNIPDIDETGIRKGRELALRYIEVKTIWLPASLRKYKDHRGNARKDLRDWMDLHPGYDDFHDLMKRAKSARFWVSKNKNCENKYSIDTVLLHYFLWLNGFSALSDRTNRKDVRLIQVNGYVVEDVMPRDVREFVRHWVDQNIIDHEVMNLILNSTKLILALDSLPERKLDFTDYSPLTQTFFFQNVCVEVSGSGMKIVKRDDYKPSTYVLADSVIPHCFKKLDDFFSVVRETTPEGTINFNLQVNRVESKVMGYFINSSRLYWRKEMESRFSTSEERSAYAKEHRFDLFGEGLTGDEIGEQVQNFLNKVFVVGYMLHGFKSPSRPWAPFAMDNRIGTDSQCNGGSGKSFFFKVLEKILQTVTISGKDPRILDNNHAFERIHQNTRMVVVSDCSKYLDIERFYDSITDGVTVNPKNQTSFTIPFEDAPKWAFTTNFVPSNFDPSSVRRMLFMVFSDYYHEMTEENDYIESRSIRDDFGMDLLTSTYTEEDWNADLNFLLQCEKFYLSTLNSSEIIKVMPPMKNIIIRKNLAVMGDSFQEWAESYFSINSGHLNKYLVKDEVFNACKSSTGIANLKSTKFKSKLRAFVEVTPWIDELNPAEKLNDGNRIKQRMQGYELPVEVLYLSSSEAPFL